MKILSLGAGVQSSCLALLAKHGEIDMPDYAISADVGAEPQLVYDYLNYLTPLVPFEVRIVKKGDLHKDFLQSLDTEGTRASSPPLMVWNKEKEQGARLWRKCTADYKIEPIKREIQKLRNGEHVEQMIGISLDEAHRMKPSRVKYMTNTYPLIDLRMNRHDCLQWIKNHDYQLPPKSACWFCPYMSNRRLRWMKDNTPEEWNKLVGFDHEIRQRQRQRLGGAKITGDLYVHRDCIPIDQVDLTNDSDLGQMDMFGEECEGMCGL